MNKIREVGLPELRIFPQHVVEQIVQLSLFLLLAQKILDESFGLVLEVRIERWVKGGQMLNT